MVKVGNRLRKAFACLAEINPAAGPQSEIYNHIYLLFPTFKEEDYKAYTVMKLQKVTKEEVVAALQPLGVLGLIPKDQVCGEPDGAPDDDAVPISLLGQIELHDGGEYVVIFGKAPLDAQLKSLGGWQNSMTSGMENAAGVRAVKALKEAGHPEAVRFCGTKKVRRPGSKETALEVDAAAIAEGCALVVECKAKLDRSAAEQLVNSMRTLTELIEEGVPAVEPFRGKRLMGALCGKTVTTNSSDRRKMEELCKQHDLEIWLPSGQDYDVGDGCVISPCAPTCSALAQSASRPASILRNLPRYQLQRRPMLGSRFLSQRPKWLACSRPSIRGIVGFK